MNSSPINPTFDQGAAATVSGLQAVPALTQSFAWALALLLLFLGARARRH